MSERFDGRVAIVTGAGKGLGRAYARWLAARGCAVVVNNRVRPEVPPSAEGVVEEIRAAGGTAVADSHAVEDEAGAAALVQAALDAFGRLDILICNAGIATQIPFGAISTEELRRVIDVNLWGTLYPLHAAWPRMVAAGYGRIVLTSSSVGLFGYGTSAAYGAAKGGMIGLARSLALDVPAEADLRINVIAPFAYTPMSREQIDAAYAETLSPDKVAPVVGWLASEVCRESGMIFHAGGGRVTRARVLESPPATLTSGGLGPAMARLDALLIEPEAGEASESGARIMRY